MTSFLKSIKQLSRSLKQNSIQSRMSRSLIMIPMLTLASGMIAHRASANQIPTSGTAWTGAGTTAAATKDTPSGLRTTIGISGSGITMGSRTSATAQTGNTITNPTIPATTNGMQILVTANASCNNTALVCNSLGTVTFNFTDTAGNPILVKNPVIHMSRLGGAQSYTTTTGISANYYLGAILTLNTTGATIAATTGNRGFQVTGGNRIEMDYATFPASAVSGTFIGDCTVTPNAPQAGCGSIPVTGLVSSLSFNVDMNRSNTSGNWQNAVSNAWSADGIYFTVSFDEDFGDAPASYDPTTAASHIVSDLALGSTIDVDNPTISNGAATGTTSITPSPNAIAAGANNNGTNGDGADEDAITSFPDLASNDTSYALTVPISGASRAGQVCGWIDLNRNNVFDNATERACGSFTIGATTVNLNWTGLSGLTAGNNYVRLRASYDTIGVQNPTGRLSSGEVEDYQITIEPANNPIPPSLCSIAGGIRGTNLFANNGTFGTGSLTPATSTQLPPGRTTYTFQNYSSATPNDGGYAIVNQLNQNTFSGSWHNTFGHTTGTVDDQVMVVNAAATPGTFYTETLTVPANQNIEFSAWILNLIKASWSGTLPMKPDISFVINRIGVDDNNNGTIDEPGEGQVITTSGVVPNTSTPTWLNYGAIVNTGNATQIEYRLVNNGPGGLGNDLLLDDLFAAPCSPLPQGNITGTLYRDLNTNNLYNSGTDVTLPANIAVNLKSAAGVIVATAYTDASGNYDFTNVPAGTNYTIEVALTDTDIPSGVTATANPTGANTTGMQTGITVTSGATLANQNFGFVVVPPLASISGTVFEDPNYGGGAGRNLATPTTLPRDGAKVELYKNDGTYIANTITSGGGKYTFTGVASGDYKVRVVNSTVTSSRPGYVAGLLPVQTFRTDATTGTVTDVTDHVGGEKPKEIDAPANTTANLSILDTATQEVQSLTTVKVANTTVSGIDFGYNFDTIVNTNNTGQGSLRQFITNSNTLTNAGLAQVGQTAGKEVSIFMIPDGAAHAGLRAGVASGINGTGGNANAAVISLASNFSITDANTQLDATTQTTNVGDLNPGTVGTGGTVGVDGLALSTIPKPEVVFDLRLVPTNTNAMIVKGGNTVLKGFASYGYRTTGNLSTLLKAAIVVDAVVPDASRAIITQLLGGTMADGSDPVVPTIDVGYTLQTAGAADITNNYLAYNSDAITFENTNGTSVNFIDNELAYNGPKNNNGSNGSGIYADQMETVQGTKNITLRGNLVRNSTKPGYANSQGQGIQISYSSFITLENNTFTDNNVYAINASSSDTLIRKNIVAGTKNTGLGQGSGIVVYYGGPLNTGLRNRITQNSIYQNAKLGIDHQVDGVTPNDGTIGAAQPNNGIDYPIVTSSLLNGNDLVVKGYVGNVATGSPTFANVTLEFFIADDDGNNNGKVFSTDPATVSKPHGEGKTYIGTCTTSGNSLFDCTFANVNSLMPSGQTFDPKNITATATDAAGNTSEFSSVPMVNNPNVLLVKRITAINGSTSTFSGDSLAGYIDELTNAYDDNTITIPTQLTPTDPPKDTDNWPTLSSFMLGDINGGNVKPDDEIEYTIYFLSAGEAEAKNVLFCDRVPSNVSFIPTAFNSFGTKATGGLAGDRGILSVINGTTASFTNLADGDAARYFPPGSDPTSIYPNLNCGGSNANGAVVINLGNLPNATAPGTPAGAFGFVRFKGRIK
jgi:hypothetical protein